MSSDRYERCKIPDDHRCQARCPDAFLREAERPRCVNHATVLIKDEKGTDRRLCNKHAQVVALKNCLVLKVATVLPRANPPMYQPEFVE